MRSLGVFSPRPIQEPNFPEKCWNICLISLKTKHPDQDETKTGLSLRQKCDKFQNFVWDKDETDTLVHQLWVSSGLNRLFAWGNEFFIELYKHITSLSFSGFHVWYIYVTTLFPLRSYNSTGVGPLGSWGQMFL